MDRPSSIQSCKAPSSKSKPSYKTRPTQRAPDWWESARFQALYVATSWFRQNGVVASRPPAGNASRWATQKQIILGGNILKNRTQCTHISNLAFFNHFWVHRVLSRVSAFFCHGSLRNCGANHVEFVLAHCFCAANTL